MGWWVCEGHFDTLEGTFTQDFSTDFGPYSRAIEFTASTQTGTIRIWFKASDGSTVSGQATPGNPVTLSGEVMPSFEQFPVSFEAMTTNVTDVDYTLYIGP
jgi:hypothetical protein